MNIVELNQSEVSAVSGGFFAEIGALAGQAAGIGGAIFVYTVYSEGMSAIGKKMDGEYDDRKWFVKAFALLRAGIGLAHLSKVWGPTLLVMGGNLALSSIGGLIDRYWYGNKG